MTHLTRHGLTSSPMSGAARRPLRWPNRDHLRSAEPSLPHGHPVSAPGAFAGYVEEEGEEQDETLDRGGDESQFSDDPVSAANDFLPASQGLSFFTTAAELTVRARAAEYETLSGAPPRRL